MLKRIDEASINEQSILQFKLEFIVLNKLNSPFQVSLVDAFYYKQKYVVVIEAMEGQVS